MKDIEIYWNETWHRIKWKDTNFNEPVTRLGITSIHQLEVVRYGYPKNGDFFVTNSDNLAMYTRISPTIDYTTIDFQGPRIILREKK